MEETFINARSYQGESVAVERVQKWIQTFQSRAEDDGSLEIEIIHLVVGAEDDDEPFDTVEVTVDKTPEQLAKHVVDLASDYCEGMDSGKVRFLVKVQGIRKKATFNLKIDSGGMTGDEVDEAPNTRGMIMQQMRHAEVLVESNTNMAAKAVQMFERAGHVYESICASQQKELQSLRSVHVETIKAYEDINSSRHIRDLELLKLQNSEKRMDQVAGLLMQGAPHLLNKFLGGAAGDGRPQVVKEGWTPLEQMLLGFIATFDKDQLDKVVGSGVFSPVQLMGFHQLLTSLFEKKEILEKEEAEKRSKMNGDANGQTQGQAASNSGAQQKEPAYQT